MYPIKTKVLPDYEIDWNFDNSKLKLNVLKKNQINLFDIEKFFFMCTAKIYKIN